MTLILGLILTLVLGELEEDSVAVIVTVILGLRDPLLVIDALELSVGEMEGEIVTEPVADTLMV